MKILSLFDGMSCGYMAFLLAGIEVESYDAFEIDPYAIKVSKHNFPKINHHGNVFDGDFTQFAGYDFLIGGSPCTYWSIAQTPDIREKSAEGEGWTLFNEYLRALREAKPMYFIFENNSSMDDEVRAAIDNAFGIEATELNSALVSAQNRCRLYWAGIRQDDGSYRKITIRKPDDRGILLRDILESGYALREKSNVIDANYYKGGNHTKPERQSGARNYVAEPVCINSKDGDNKQPPVQDRIYNIDGKSTALLSSNFNNRIAVPVDLDLLSDGEMNYTFTETEYRSRQNFINKPAEEPKSKCVVANFCKGVPYNILAEPANGRKGYHPIYEVRNGMIRIKDKEYPVKISDGEYIIRKLTIRECMRLQTVPEWFDFSCISKTQAYKCLGNGWTIEIIRHLIACCLAGEVDGKQMSIFDLL